MDRAQHVVLFKFPQELTAEEEAYMFAAIRAWPDAISGFTGLRFGRDVSGRSNGYGYLLLTEFENEDAHQAYYSHPKHVEFGKWVADHNCDVLRVDYPLTEESMIL